MKYNKKPLFVIYRLMYFTSRAIQIRAFLSGTFFTSLFIFCHKSSDEYQHFSVRMEDGTVKIDLRPF